MSIRRERRKEGTLVGIVLMNLIEYKQYGFHENHNDHCDRCSAQAK